MESPIVHCENGHEDFSKIIKTTNKQSHNKNKAKPATTNRPTTDTPTQANPQPTNQQAMQPAKRPTSQPTNQPNNQLANTNELCDNENAASSLVSFRPDGAWCPEVCQLPHVLSPLQFEIHPDDIGQWLDKGSLPGLRNHDGNRL